MPRFISFENVALIMEVADRVHCSSSDNLRVCLVGVCPHSRKDRSLPIATSQRFGRYRQEAAALPQSLFTAYRQLIRGRRTDLQGESSSPPPYPRRCLIRAGFAGLSINSATSQVDGLVTHSAGVEASPAATGLREVCEASAEGLPEEPDAMFEVLLAPPDGPLP